MNLSKRLIAKSELQWCEDQSLVSFFILTFLAQPFRENIIGLDNGGFSGQFAIISFIFYLSCIDVSGFPSTDSTTQHIKTLPQNTK